MLKTTAQILSWIALAATVITPVVFLAGKLELDTMKLWLTVATIAWFAATPIWMERGEV